MAGTSRAGGTDPPAAPPVPGWPAAPSREPRSRPRQPGDLRRARPRPPASRPHRPWRGRLSPPRPGSGRPAARSRGRWVRSAPGRVCGPTMGAQAAAPLNVLSIRPRGGVQSPCRGSGEACPSPRHDPGRHEPSCDRSIDDVRPRVMTPVATTAPGVAEWPVWTTTARLVVTDKSVLVDAAALVFEQLARVDAAASRFHAGSEVSRLARGTGAPKAVSPLLAELLGVALAAAAATEGAVDPTLGRPLRDPGYPDRADARQSDASPEPVAADRPRRAVRRRTSWTDVRLDGRLVTMPAGTLLDLGATAKAYAADLCAAPVADQFGCGALVSLGGDSGPPAPPRTGAGRCSCRTARRAGQSCPAGRRRRRSRRRPPCTGRWRQGDRALHHVLDPATCRPARAGLADRLCRRRHLRAGQHLAARPRWSAATARSSGAAACRRGRPAGRGRRTVRCCGWAGGRRDRRRCGTLGRGTGVTRAGAAHLVVVLGIVTRSGRPLPGLPRFAVAAVHRTASLTALGFWPCTCSPCCSTRTRSCGWWTRSLPFRAAYRPVWQGLGTVALDLVMLLVASSVLRHRIGPRAWRGVHWVAYLCWPVGRGARGRHRHRRRQRVAAGGRRVLRAAVVGAAGIWRLAGRRFEPRRPGRPGAATDRPGRPVVTEVRTPARRVLAAAASSLPRRHLAPARPAARARRRADPVGWCRTAGLTGRGGAGFPTARKLAAVARRRRRGGRRQRRRGRAGQQQGPVLLLATPRTWCSTACRARGPRPPGDRGLRCYAPDDLVGWPQRHRRGSGRDPLAVAVGPRAADTFVAGQESAAIAAVEGRAGASPRHAPPCSSSAACGGRPTLVQNVETLAHLAPDRPVRAGLVPRSRHRRRARAPACSRSSGAVVAPGCVRGARRRHASRRPPGSPAAPPAAAGGAGRRLPRRLGARRPTPRLPLTRAGLAPYGAAPGAGVLLRAPGDAAGWSPRPRSPPTWPGRTPASAVPAATACPGWPSTCGELATGVPRPARCRARDRAAGRAGGPAAAPAPTPTAPSGWCAAPCGSSPPRSSCTWPAGAPHGGRTR